MIQIVLYGRPGCHLCDDARTILERVRSRRPFALTEVDIERDEELLRRHLERIPVIELEGEEIFTLFINEGELERLIAARSAGPRR